MSKPTDEELLEEITAAFTKALIKNKMKDPIFYLKLTRRLAALIDAELRWKFSQEENQILMSIWGPEVN